MLRPKEPRIMTVWYLQALTRADNGKYVRRGRGLVAAYGPGREADLWDADRRKNGAPFPYADGPVMVAAALRIPYRQLSCHGPPSYPTLYRRMQRLDVDVHGGKACIPDTKDAACESARTTPHEANQDFELWQVETDETVCSLSCSKTFDPNYRNVVSTRQSEKSDRPAVSFPNTGAVPHRQT